MNLFREPTHIKLLVSGTNSRLITYFGNVLVLMNLFREPCSYLHLQCPLICISHCPHYSPAPQMKVILHSLSILPLAIVTTKLDQRRSHCETIRSLHTYWVFSASNLNLYGNLKYQEHHEVLLLRYYLGPYFVF